MFIYQSYFYQKRERKITALILFHFSFTGTYDAISQGKEASVKFYNDWTEDVKKTVPKERLLVFSVKEGWEPLCKFLDIPIPDEPFPNTNDSKTIQKMYKRTKIKAYLFVLGLPIILGLSAYYLWSL